MRIITRPAGNGASTGPGYADAARMLRDWQDEGILVPDPAPALYVYEQSLPGGHVLQRGLIGALRLAPLGAGPVLPHEDVIPGPVAGRRRLMEATGANLEPIFLLYDGNGPSHRHGADHRAGDAREPLVALHTEDGIWHRLWGRDRSRAAGGDRRGSGALTRPSSRTGTTATPPTSSSRSASGRPGPVPGPGMRGSPCWWTPPRSRHRSARSTGWSPGCARRRPRGWRSGLSRCGRCPGRPAEQALADLAETGEGHVAFLIGGGRSSTCSPIPIRRR